MHLDEKVSNHKICVMHQEILELTVESLWSDSMPYPVFLSFIGGSLVVLSILDTNDVVSC